MVRFYSSGCHADVLQGKKTEWDGNPDSPFAPAEREFLNNVCKLERSKNHWQRLQFSLGSGAKGYSG
jgi:hypothetical protein